MTDMRVPSGAKAVLVLILVVVALAACRQQEQGRVLLYEKGTYLGKRDAGLTAVQRAALERRATLQATGSGQAISVPIAAGGTAGESRTLGERALKQGGK